MNNNSKLVYVEQLRVLAILNVITIHCYAKFFTNCNIFGTKIWWMANILNGLTRWGVPIFFMISGMLLLGSNKEESLKYFLKRRILKILLPFILCSFLYYVDSVLQNKSEINIKVFVINLLQRNISYHLWFIYVIFEFYLITPILKKWVKSCTNKELWYFFGIMFYTITIRPFMNKFFGIYITAILPIIDGYLVWFIYGYLINSINFKRIYRIIIYILGIIGVIFSIIGTYLFSSSKGIDTFFNGGYQFNSYFIATAIFVFFKYDLGKINELSIIKKISMKMGKMVYGVYLIHAFILNKINYIIKYNKPYKEIIINWILVVVLSFLIMILINGFIKKIFRFFKNVTNLNIKS